MTELQFWQKAKKAFEKPSAEKYSDLGVCYFLDWGVQLSQRRDDIIYKKIRKEVIRLGKQSYLDKCGKRSPIRLRFINRMIRQCKVKK